MNAKITVYTRLDPEDPGTPTLNSLLDDLSDFFAERGMASSEGQDELVTMITVGELPDELDLDQLLSFQRESLSLIVIPLLSDAGETIET